MTEFLLKSTLSMAVLLGLYHLLLEREKMHRFNRFYLVGALIFSLAIPFVTIPVYVQTVAAPQETVALLPGSAMITTTVPEINYMPYILGIIYTSVTFLLAVRFMLNVSKFRKKTATGAAVNYQGAKLVLLDEETLPHTFLHYIFLNRSEFEDRTIEDELFTHELVHVRQKHTLDILFIEVLRILLWFNPLLYFYKRAIQLNHEFLADEVVVESTHDTTYYQELLLDKARLGTTFSLASNLNFSITKKRFTMMTKSTTNAKAALLQAIVLPVIACLTILCCTETIAQESTPKVDYSKVSKIDVLTPTPAEIDSIRRAEPAKFKEEPNTRILRANYTLNENGKEKVVSTYEKTNDYKSELSKETTNGLAGIDPDKIKSININNVTEAEMGSLMAADPEKYRDIKAVDLRSIIVVYADKDDAEVEKRYYERYTPPSKQVNNGVKAWDPDRQPEFSEGSFIAYVTKNLKLPKVDEELSVTVFASFVVETDGSISNVKILRDPGHGIGYEIKKVVEKSPKWKPGTKDGKPTRTSMSSPIPIKIKN